MGNLRAQQNLSRSDAEAATMKNNNAVLEGMVYLLERALAPLIERIKRLENKPAPLPGKDGIDGAPGKDGRDGVNGKDGIDGKDGKNGIDGKPGNDGAPGRDGVDGVDGKDGERGIDGRDGRDGAPGKDGRDGIDGRDAAAIAILPAIDPERSYQARTFASHKGGLWHSVMQTQGMDGWQCLVQGYPEIQVTQEGVRGAKIKITRSDGIEFVHEFSFPTVIYRGIYKDGEQYEPGDQVTWAGSQWHCNEPTRDKPLTGSKAWTLVVKKGKDGRSGGQS